MSQAQPWGQTKKQEDDLAVSNLASASSLTSLCLCGECDDTSGECSSGSASNPPLSWTSGGAKPQSLTIEWIGSDPAPNSIDVRFKKKATGIQQVFGINGTYFFEKPPVCSGCNNLYISDSNADDIATLHISCSNTLYVGQKFGLGSGSGNDNACEDSCTPIFKVVGACVLNGDIEQCTGDQTGNPNDEEDYEFVCSAPTLEPAPSPFPTEFNIPPPPPPEPPEPTVSEACKLSYYLCHTVPFANLSLR